MVPGDEMLTVCVPLSATKPDQAPVAVQLMAANEDQVRVVDPPTGTRGLARDMTGATNAVVA